MLHTTNYHHVTSIKLEIILRIILTVEMFYDMKNTKIDHLIHRIVEGHSKVIFLIFSCNCIQFIEHSSYDLDNFWERRTFLPPMHV